MTQRKSVLDRLNSGEVIVGDGGILFAMERRGYATGGQWTPEASVEHPEAVRQLHREFIRAGCDVIQPFTYFSSNSADPRVNGGLKYSSEEMNTAAFDLATDLVKDSNIHIVGSLTPTTAHKLGMDKEEIKAIYRDQLKTFSKYNVDLLLCEFFERVSYALIALEVCKELNLPVAISMCIGPEGDLNDVSIGECAVQLAQAGADIVGVNCCFGPIVSLQSMKLMKEALDKAGLKTHLMCQPAGFLTPDAPKEGYMKIPEFPFAVEPRTCTRFEIAHYARSAFEIGVRYIGGCCGFEPYHIRAVAEELAPERGHLPAASEKHKPWGGMLAGSNLEHLRERASRPYWENLKPICGRQCCNRKE